MDVLKIPQCATLRGALVNLTNSHSNQRTRNQFRPRNATKGTSSYQLRQYAEATLGGGSLRKIVKLPEGEDENEWLAVNSMRSPPHITERANDNSGRLLQSHQSTIRLDYRVLLSTIMSRNEGYGRVCMLYYWVGTLLTDDRFEYLWQDSENFKRPTKMPAPTYIEHLMGWVQSNIDNEAVFPSRIGMSRPLCFLSAAKHIRCPIPEILPKHDPTGIQENVSCLRSHLLPPLPSRQRTWS